MKAKTGKGMNFNGIENNMNMTGGQVALNQKHEKTSGADGDQTTVISPFTTPATPLAASISTPVGSASASTTLFTKKNVIIGLVVISSIFAIYHRKAIFKMLS